MNVMGNLMTWRWVVSAVFLATVGLVSPEKAFAETWTDATGSFSLDAKFVGVSGRDIVLQKADGKTIHVPIARLSDASRAQAKKLYELSKAAPTGGVAAAAMPAVATASQYKPTPRELNFTPPSPPAIPLQKPFPENASLEATWNHVRDEAMAGHLEVFWQALPDDIRELVDGQEIRDRLRPYADDKFSVSPEMTDVVNKLTELLVTKKPFILNSPLLAQVPPDFRPLIEQGYDPTVGLVHEFAEMSFNTEAIFDHTMSDFLNYHLPRFGAHLQLLLKVMPPEVKDSLLSQVTVDQTSETTGTITLPGEGGNPQTVEMVRYYNRWLPKDMVDSWLEEKDTVIDKMVDNAASGVAAGNSPETAAMIKSVIEQANQAMGPLLAANSQQEFDFAVGQAIAPFMMMLGGAGGGGPAALPGLPQ